jgi:integrase
MPEENRRNLSEFDLAGRKLVAQPKTRRSAVKTRRFNFTQKALDSVPLPASGEQRRYVYDTQVRGLGLAVSPAGKKVFILCKKIDGRAERIAIGSYAEVSIGFARNKVQQLLGAIAEGENPADQKRRVRSEWTLGQLFQYWLTEYAQSETKSWAKDENLFKNHLHPWRLKRISEIRKSDVVTLHAKIGRTRGKYAANRTIELLCSIFNRAIDEWGWDGKNPAAEITAFKEKKRDRFLEAGELPRFFLALREEENETVRDYILISLLCGARRSNVQAMRWGELHLERHIWRIPETKNGDAQDVYLPLPAQKILLTRLESANGCEWVFPGRGKTGHLVEPKTAFKRILKRAGLTDVRLHDLRRTLGSWQAATGSTLPIIGKTLGHKSLAATQIYARLDLDPVRVAVDRATTAMLAAGQPAKLLED